MRRSLGIMLFLITGFAVNAQILNPDFEKKLSKLYSHTVPLISASELREIAENGERPVILDTRQREEYEVSHIPTALFINYNRFSKEDVADIPKDQKIIVYCSVGYRSEKIGARLKKMGYKEVYNLYGGIFEWVNQQHKVVDGSGVATQRVHTYNRDWAKWLDRGIKVW